ncbi:MAG: adenosylcobinamide-GDP ribazoletransferase [Chloroflexi bacterium]|nr:adenosylcobinamide-GDP ribazoletransferase [Chloroflexota bacterium]
MKLASRKRRRTRLGFWAALQFLTILPSPVRRAYSTRDIGNSLIYFPIVGLLLGLFLWGLSAGLSFAFPRLVVSVLLIVAATLVTGAMHLDGFIDTWDAMAARRTVQQRLDIMKDSHVGAFGVVGGCLLIVLKITALYSVPYTYLAAALISMPVLGRWAMVYSIFANPYARGKEGTGHAFKQEASGWRFGLASLLALLTVAAASRGWHGVVLMVVVGLAAFALSAYFRSRFGGLTGDTYGALNELSEVVVLLLLPLVWRAA